MSVSCFHYFCSVINQWHNNNIIMQISGTLAAVGAVVGVGLLVYAFYHANGGGGGKGSEGSGVTGGKRK